MLKEFRSLRKLLWAKLVVFAHFSLYLRHKTEMAFTIKQKQSDKP